MVAEWVAKTWNCLLLPVRLRYRSDMVRYLFCMFRARSLVGLLALGGCLVSALCFVWDQDLGAGRAWCPGADWAWPGEAVCLL